MERPDITEAQFDTALLIRRRSLLGIYLRIYIWIGMIAACVGFIALAGIAIFDQHHTLSPGESVIIAMLGVAGFGCLFFVPASLWFEWKWAIRYNWGVGLGLVLMSFGFISDSFNGWMVVVKIIPIPYWILLYKIQHAWEQEAISTSQYEAGNNI
jgi:hypothetical protein